MEYLCTRESLLIETLLKIANKQGQDVDFNLNSAQQGVDMEIARMQRAGAPVRLKVPKARQRGVSSYAVARAVIKCCTKRNTSARIISHKEKSTMKLLEKARYYIKHMKGAKPTLKYNSRNEISFPITDSTLSIYTAGSDEEARGDFITDLHCSEIAFWPDPKNLAASLFEAVPTSGEIVHESTGNGAQTWWHKSCLDARVGLGEYKLYFIPWHSSPEYCLPVDGGTHTVARLAELHKLPQKCEARTILGNLMDDYEEPELLERYPNLCAGQLLWRRNKITSLSHDVVLFKQEYPMTLDECFRPSGQNFFHRVHYFDKDPRWIVEDKEYSHLKGHPDPHLTYVLGADVSGGVGQDSSVIQIGCVETMEQVGIWRSNTISPDDFAYAFEELGELYMADDYGWPLAVIESNNHGIATLDNLIKNEVYDAEKLYTDNPKSTNIIHSGLRTTKASKRLYIGRLRKALADEIKFYDPVTMGELSTFTDKFEGAEGCHDDCVIALAMMNVGFCSVADYLESEEQDKRERVAQSPAPDPTAPIYQRNMHSHARHRGQPVSCGIRRVEQNIMKLPNVIDLKKARVQRLNTYEQRILKSR